MAGKPDKALEAYEHMVDAIDESMKAGCLDWSNEFKKRCSAALAEQNVEIPGQEQDDYDTEPNFFRGMRQYSQISRLRPQQRPGHLKRVKLALTKILRSAPPPAPAPAPAPPTAPPLAVAPTTITARLGNLFSWRSHHAGPPVVDVSYAPGQLRYAAAGAPGSDDSLIRDEDYHGPPTPDPNLQRAVQVDPGEHGGGWSCHCW